MKIKMLRIAMLLSVVSCAALLNGCGSSSKEGTTGSTNGGVALVDEGTCITCHSTTIDPVSGLDLVNEYANAAHNLDVGGPGCQGCHGGGAEHNGVGPIPFPNPLAINAATGMTQCSNAACHGGADSQIPGVVATENTSLNFPNECSHCHSITANGGIHAAQVTSKVLTANDPNNDPNDCVFCHNVAAPQHGTLVNDNAGVRNVVQEFGKWSHHVTGVTLNKAHCAACHMEGTVSNGAIVIDQTKHMVDNMVHLRNVNNDTDMQWNPENPNFTAMDNFCMGCHSATGASSPMSAQIQIIINANNIVAAGKLASPTNPFGDTISNQYDLMQRPAVVDVASQFNTANPSHHAVMGQRYSGRTRVAGATRVVSNPGNTGVLAFARNSTATLPGARTTIYDAGKLNATYRTLSPAPGTTDKTLGDDSVLHCAECHTVGQFATRGSVAFGNLSTAFGSGITNFYKTAIGAHGSNNEYLLRNSIGSDHRHQGIQSDSKANYFPDKVTPYLVCFNCHAINTYGINSHVGEQNSGDQEGNCDAAINTNSVNLIGANRLQDTYSFTFGTDVFGAPVGSTNSNIFGIQCSNCHASGISAGNIFGGIHGAKDATYTDGAGNTTKHERFLPGLGNVMYVPGTKGGIFGGHSSAAVTNNLGQPPYKFLTGGTTNDANWEENASVRFVGIIGTGSHSHQAGPAGCYTISNGTTPATDPEGTGITSSLVPAANGLTAPNGQLLYGNWGGCSDHSQAPGTSVRAPRNGETSIRPVTY
ncbi:MAG: hypothetical protein P4L44_15370 [Oryzomonas sp.]|uniref:hypothetical protein n=1 Tax=Oryzomonas sp. TaxID=2855186 RepID=UPI002850263D|nr:hypothetical protein [Oryzomonas sp.]MDR3581339.1 hypothetical protein [Oryzomonas sp.]